MKLAEVVLAVIISLMIPILLPAQSICTVNGTAPTTITWVANGSGQYTCTGTGTETVLLIPAGITVTFDSNDDTWVGTRIEVFGTLNISFNGQIEIFSSIHIKSGGYVNVFSKLFLGKTTGCGYTLIVDRGGILDLAQGGADDRLHICGKRIAQSGGQCYPYPGTQTPYCEPTASGFPGPTGFSEGGIIPLPVSLIAFSITELPSRAVVATWATATEKNADYFAIQRSSNGRDFYEIGRTPAAGNSIVRQDYSFSDNAPLIGRSYYRLKQVDFDGTTEYFPMKFIDINGKKQLSAFPNPLESDHLNLRLNFTSEEIAFAKIYNSSGTLIHSFSFSGTDFQLPVKLSSGAYLVKLNTGRDQLLSRFIVR